MSFPANDIPALIEQYQAEASRLEQSISSLKAQLHGERNLDKWNSLFKRIDLLEIERLEILEDIRNMLPYAE